MLKRGLYIISPYPRAVGGRERGFKQSDLADDNVSLTSYKPLAAARVQARTRIWPVGTKVMPSYPLYKHSNTSRDEQLTLQRNYKFAGRFKLIEPIGRGGFGQVWRVHDLQLRQEVALKISLEKMLVETISLRRMSRNRFVSIF